MSGANKLTNQILQFLYEQGAYCWRQNTGGVYEARRGIYRTAPKKGVSDILGVYRGRMIAVEVKIGRDKLSPEQQGFLANIEHFGGAAFVAKDLDSFKEWFSSIRRESA